MFRVLMRTQNDVGMLIARVAFGASLLPHGLEKLGLFNDQSEGIFKSMEQVAEQFQQNFGFDPWMTYLAIAAEVVGSIALIFGFFGRFCALCMGGVMVAAAWKAHGLADGLWLDWWRETAGSYHILAVLVALAVVIRGSGALSVDRSLSKG